MRAEASTTEPRVSTMMEGDQALSKMESREERECTERRRFLAERLRPSYGKGEGRVRVRVRLGVMKYEVG
jgi:hypothetical protein